VTFPTLEDVRRFIGLLLRSRHGVPLLAISTKGGYGLTVSGTWEDHLGVLVAVIEDNRLVWSRSSALVLLVHEETVTLMLDGDILWQVSAGRHGIAIEGMFFSSQGMVMITPWGYVGWSDEEVLRLMDGAAAQAATSEAPEAILPPAHPPRLVH